MNRLDDSGLTADPREDQLLEAVNQYVKAVEAGQRVNRQQFIARHPEIANELSACLAGLALVNAAADASGPGPNETDSELSLHQPLGDFRLLREIGRGGMGIVYEATQLSLGRRVAVKVLPLAASLDQRRLQRFHNEAQAAAQLHHTNIVPVYAVGCERSVHFYAMQFIEGQSLSDVIASLRATARLEPNSQGDPPAQSPNASATLAPLLWQRPAAYYRSVARLGASAAEALHHAHQQGIVHRDIKPANLLLDLHGQVWVTDFGLAQMYAETGNLTQSGDLLGTLRYMSPEQASGRAVVLDQRTDVYSLGLTLYELLTLHRALDGDSREQLLAQISEHEPRPLRQIDRRIPVELENIIRRAIAKDPAERYPNAIALADDLRRFLEDKPVLARPPSLYNRASKWVRRHKTLAGAAVVLLVLLAIGLAIGDALLSHQQAQTNAALLAEQRRSTEAEQARQLADRNFREARAAVDAFTEVALGQQSDPRFAQTRWELLETSAGYYQSFLDEHRDDASLASELRQAENRVNSVLAVLFTVDELMRTTLDIQLLREASVQQELSLTQQQIASAQLVALKYMFGPPPNHPDSSLTPDQVNAVVSRELADRKTALEAVLGAAQLERLKQISRQVRGAYALTDSDVMRELSLSPAQKRQVRLTISEFHSQSHEFGPFHDHSAKDTAVIDRLIAQLSPAQRQTWGTLIGARFDDAPSLRERLLRPPHGGPDHPPPPPDRPDQPDPFHRG